jgi:hypothetical protein
LQDFVPVILGQVNDNWHKHWERFLLIGLQDVEEVIVLKEAHGSISNLQVDTTNAFYNSLEELWDQMFNFVDLANFKHLLQFCQEQRFFDAIGKGPELEQAFQKRNSQSSIFSQEQHRAPQ